MAEESPTAPRTTSLTGKRIIVFLGGFELGGAERQAVLLARHLRHDQGAIVEVWGFNDAGPVVGFCEEAGLLWRIVSRPSRGGHDPSWFGLSRLAWRLRQARPDVLLPYTLVPNVVCGALWRLTGARACVWNQRDAGVARLDTALERRAVRRTSRFVANSQASARFLVDAMGVVPSRIRIVRNGVDRREPAHDRRWWRTRLKIDDGRFIACMVANLSSRKDHRTLLLAWRDVVEGLRAQGRSALLLLAGRFDDAHESLVALAWTLKIVDSVQFLGPVADVSGLLDMVDVGVFSSRSEGCPNGVLECMAAGLPVVGTDTDGISDAVGQAGGPFLAPVDDASAFAERILRLADDPTLRADQGALNRRRAGTCYDTARMQAETVAVLSECLR